MGVARKKTSAPRKEKGEGRDKIKEENPGFGVTEVSKKAGEMWSKIDGDTKERFEKKARAAKEKYEEEYKEWFEGGGEDALKAQKKERKAGSGSSPKKSPKKKSAGASSSAMSGKGFKSAEYIKDSGSSSDEDKGGNKSGSGSGSGGGKSD